MTVAEERRQQTRARNKAAIEACALSRNLRGVAWWRRALWARTWKRPGVMVHTAQRGGC